jgi:threonylcarbamoyladenosine tRNA methylthiotransferase MtaB
MVHACRRTVPGITITTDLIVGFPGETDAEFEEGYRFIREVGFDGMHVFKYSQRSGTRAARMPDQAPEEVKQERSALLRQEATAAADGLRSRHVGVVAQVAWESEREGVRRGLTDTNVRVYGSPDAFRANGLSRVRLDSAFRDGLWAEPGTSDIPLVPAASAAREV